MTVLFVAYCRLSQRRIRFGIRLRIVTLNRIQVIWSAWHAYWTMKAWRRRESTYDYLRMIWLSAWSSCPSMPLGKTPE